MYASVRIILFVPLIQASHFRGALFSWSPNSDGSVDIDFRISWRRSSTGNYCNSSIISNNIIVGDTGDIECYDGCSGILGSVRFYCTDFSVEQDWTTGRNTIKYTPTTTKFSFGFSGAAWVSLNGPHSGSWSFKASVDLSPRSDTGTTNTSPTVDMAPVIRLKHGCQHTIIIPVSDADGDIVRCRWASGADECADVCASFPGSSLDETHCILTYSANDATGYYAVALQIEDFLDESSNTPMSSIPMQFLVDVFEMSGSACSEKPKFVQPTPQEGSCYNALIGEIMHVTIKATSRQRLRSITTISAVGMQRSSEIKSQDSSVFYISVNVTWTPSQHDTGKEHSLCFYASDENGLVSDIRCIHVPVSVGRPKITSVTRKGSANTWELRFNQKYLIPTASAVLEVFEKETGNKVYQVDVYNSAEVDFDPENKNMLVTFNFTFQRTAKYYVLISGGIVGRKTSCGSLSEPVDDDTFWEIDNRIDCGCPRSIENGTINATNGTFYPSVITYQCDKGFSLWGVRTRECLEHGVWSGCDPVCKSHASVMEFFVNSVRMAYNTIQRRKP